MKAQLNSPSHSSKYEELNNARIESNSLATTQSLEPQQASSRFLKGSGIDSTDKSNFLSRCLPSPSLSQRLANRSALRMKLQMQTQSIKKKSQNFASPEKKQEAKSGQSKTISVSMKKKRKILMEIDSGCSICLQPFGQVTGKLPCLHEFCFQCIDFWAKSSTKCPYCRKQFDSVTKNNGEVVTFQTKQLHIEDSEDYIEDPCYVCGTFDDIPTLLLCDKCQNKCCHIHCDPRIISEVPDYWICAMCEILEEETYTPERVRQSNNVQEIASEKVTRNQRYNLRNRHRDIQPLGVTLRPRPKRGESRRDITRTFMVTRQNARRRRR